MDSNVEFPNECYFFAPVLCDSDVEGGANGACTQCLGYRTDVEPGT
ncbi:MAG: hypothetical protein GVX96_03150 [Bacteroidetes bacterium]|nr:hypothetical protein [Bacteroidota bacterium]